MFLDSELKTIPLPDVGGFSVVISLVEPTPGPSATGSGVPLQSVVSGAPAQPAATGGIGLQSGTRLSAAPTPAPPLTPPPSPGASGQGSPAPSASASGPAGKQTPRSALASNVKAKAAATPSGPKIDTKTTIYPEDAPVAPTPQPTGNVQSYAHRTPLVRGWIISRVPVTLYSLAAVRFTTPNSELTKNRGFTIALFESLKHRKNKLVASDPAAVLADGVISASNVAPEPISLKKNVGYSFVLYGDDVGPVPTPTGSFPPANNPLLGSPGPGGAPNPGGTINLVPVTPGPNPPR